MKKLLPLLFVCVAFGYVSNLCAEDSAPAPVYHASIVDSFGKNVISVSGKLDAEVIKTKKYLFVYFSASWCPPCHTFTPKLVDFYNKNHANGDFELVFVSLDKSQGEMNGYMKSAKMPWFGLKLNSKPAQILKKKCCGSSIPCLLLLDENDKVVAESHGPGGKYLGSNVALTAYAKIKKAEKSK